MPYWRWVDQFIEAKSGLGGNLGIYDKFNKRFRQWVLNTKGVDLTPLEAGNLLQQHKYNMSAAKYTVFCWTDGPGAIWEVCNSTKAMDSWIINIDRNTRRIARDGIYRALVICRGDPAIKAHVEHELRLDIAQLNILRMRHHLQMFDVDSILARTGIF
jgi:hypothetical protein